MSISQIEASVANDRWLSILKKTFEHPDFYKRSKWDEIMGDMPDVESYRAQTAHVQAEGKKPENEGREQFYQLALLTREQEQHLFRKFNFLRFRGNRALKKKNLLKAKRFATAALEVRNQIARANFRLVNIVRNKPKSLMPDEELVSESAIWLMKAVDLFNWTLGHRFSTYGTWSLIKNLANVNAVLVRRAERVPMSVSGNEIIHNVYDRTDESVEQNYNSEIVKTLIEQARSNDIISERELTTLEHVFGLNTKDQETLEQIGKRLGISKERARQLKEKAMTALRNFALEKKLAP